MHSFDYDHPTRKAGIVLLFLVAMSLCCNAQVAEIRTADTEVRVDAGPAAPRLLVLQADATKWNNTTPETLISQARIGNRMIPLHWQFNRRASYSDERQVRYVYDSVFPRLRLSWEWFARANHGPIEHKIRIQNPDAQEVWIPLQDSLGFDWQIAQNWQLTAMYVEKRRRHALCCGDA